MHLMGLSVPDNLPARLTRFILRPHAQDGIRRLLASQDARLVTLIGTGGVGKTRLALEVAAGVKRTYRDGVWLVDLKQVRQSSSELLTRAIAEAVGVHDQSPTDLLPALCSYLRDRELLLLLDNCEHIADTAAEVAVNLLRGAPKLRVLATSRRALLTPDRGEHVYKIDAMTAPDPDDPQSGWQDSEAFALMLARAAAVGYTTATTNDHRALAQLCRRAAGLPLSIELLAAALRSASPQELLDRPLPEGVTAVWEQSYLYCSAQERLLWERLCVFGGGFDLDDAQQVCADTALPDHRIWPVLDSLVVQSLVEADTTATPTRYSLREPIREFGERRLATRDGNALTAIRAARLRHCHRLAATAAAGWFTNRENDVLLGLRSKRDQFWAASAFAETTPAYALTGLEMEVNLGRSRWPFLAGSLSVAIERLERLVTIVLLSTPTTPQISQLCLTAMAMAAFQAIAQGNPRARRLLDTCRSLGRSVLSRPPVVAVAEGLAAFLLDNDPAAAVRWLADAREASRNAERTGTAAPGDTHMTRLLLTMASAFGDNPTVARTAAEECLRDAVHAQAPWAIAWAELMVGLVHLRHDGADGVQRAIELFLSGLRAVASLDDHWLPPFAAMFLYWAVATLGLGELAAELRGSAETLRLGNDVTITALLRVGAAQRQAYRLVLPPRTATRVYEAAYQRGRRGTHAEVVPHILGKSSAIGGPADYPAGPAVDDPRWKALSRRQRDVVALIAEGLSDQEVGLRLVVQERTVHRYLIDILRETGHHGRDDLADWFNESRSPVTTVHHRQWLSLTKGQRAVAPHVADGASNRIIARRMGLSVRTVEDHVSEILKKLGFTNRAEIIAWFAEVERHVPNADLSE